MNKSLLILMTVALATCFWCGASPALATNDAPVTSSPTTVTSTALPAEPTVAALTASDLPFLSSWPAKLMLAARRFVISRLTPPTAEKTIAETTDAAAETMTNEATTGADTATDAAAMPPEKVIATSVEAGQAMGGFWRTAWQKAQPLLTRGWNFIATLVGGFFSELWTPSTSGSDTDSTDTIPDVTTAAPDTATATSPTTESSN